MIIIMQVEENNYHKLFKKYKVPRIAQNKKQSPKIMQAFQLLVTDK